MDAISLKQAQEINSSIRAVVLGVIQKSIYEAFGEILARDIICEKSLPAFDNSAMDGYALKISDIKKNIKINGRVLAGDDARDLEILDGECIKVMTGGMLPKGSEVVVPFEDVELKDNGYIRVVKDFKPNANIRFKGEEKSIGDLIAKKGDRLTHGLIGLIASQGVKNVEVYKRLKIAVYSSGNEIIEPGESAKEHQIYNINAVSIIALLRAYGYVAEYLGVLKDDLDVLKKEIEVFQKYDIVITSGGVSVGEADFFEKSLKNSGAQIKYHGINIKPGRAIMLAVLGNSTIFSLPGNPLSAITLLNTIILPTIQKLSGANKIYPKPIFAKLKAPIKLKNGRVNMVLGRYTKGEFEVYKGGNYGSNAISVINECDSIAIIGEKISQIQEDIKILPYVMEFSDTIFDIINE
ncbi:molybdopterin molybdotransferase MoeA [Helicobacter cappadocius]|uniref:Molybdopterin molybdenumtransferase n=1 Tax=Helicobacter cappadocius TaxID=3063998 RepID=A0AA90PVU3_9HELI|nr:MULTISPECIES: molybdopterin molybdotransferase MoeA [unclassified Helicobacter]MDO7253261.1 molybdopterin molybdotransferase MoeA [Helicobacter sp. faydin-H75]MDP2539185.1 molybdopterin molybdotransferase MoeA [Helicobacter sp. faydin-H76]